MFTNQSDMIVHLAQGRCHELRHEAAKVRMLNAAGAKTTAAPRLRMLRHHLGSLLIGFGLWLRGEHFSIQ
jgi:hypothetical protein